MVERRSRRPDRSRGDAVTRFTTAAVIGSAAAFVVFMVLLARKPSAFGGILDAQARALFHGHWNIPLKSFTYREEAFLVHGRYYTYFGVWPSIVRMPVLLLTSRFDGHLSAPSMLLAFAVAMVATARLHWSIRTLLRPGTPVSTGEAVSVGAFQFLVGAGSVVTFLGSRPLVYHELELWGIATALLTADCLCRYALRPSIPRALTVGAAATIAVTARQSDGFGAIAAVALLAALELLRHPGMHVWKRSWARLATLFGTGVVLPGAIYGAINEARFGSLFRLPLNLQLFTRDDALRRRALAANGGSFFGFKFAPTTMLQYTRPDAIRFSHRFPFVDFPLHRAHVIGNVFFDTLDRSSSLTACMPGLVVLAVIGAVIVVRRRGLLARAVAPAAVGLTFGTVFVLTIAYITHRYLADFMPPLVVLALVGVQAIAGAFPSLPAPGRAGVAAVTVLCVVGAWISFGLAVVYQRDLKPGDPGYGRGTAAGVSVSTVVPPRRLAASQAAPSAARITSDGSAVARKRVWP